MLSLAFCSDIIDNHRSASTFQFKHVLPKTQSWISDSQVTLPCAAFGTGVPLQMCGASQWCAGNVLPMSFAALFQPPNSARAPWTAILIGWGLPADLSWVEKISNLRIQETCGKHRPEALHFCHNTRNGAQSKAWRMIGKLEESLLHPPTILLLKRKLHRTCGFQVSTLHLSGGQDFAKTLKIPEVIQRI